MFFSVRPILQITQYLINNISQTRIPKRFFDKSLILFSELHHDFIMYSKGQFNVLRRSEVEKWCNDCMTIRYSISIDPMGNELKPCFMGEDVICETCGYAVEPITQGLFHPIKCWGSRKYLRRMI